MVDDTERRLNVLFDALNCETLTKDTVEQLHQIIQGPLNLLVCLNLQKLILMSSSAIQAGDAAYALELHLQLLTSGSSSDNLTAWMVRAFLVFVSRVMCC